MEKIWKDWIIFLGFKPSEYDNAIVVTKMWKDHLATHGLNADSLETFNKWLFNSSHVRIWHSCCLSCYSMHIEGPHIAADWIDGGGLTNLPTVFAEHGDETRIEDFDAYDITDLQIHFFEDTSSYLVLGLTLDGHIVLDTKEKFGSIDEQKRKYKESNNDYLMDFMKTVKENHKKVLLPVVPKGILKISI